TSGAMPAPVSSTLIETMPSAVGVVEITSSRLSQPSMASTALRMRLSSTCWICTLSASTRSRVGSKRKRTRTPWSLTPTSASAPALGPAQRRRAASVARLLDAPTPPLGFAAGDEVAQPPDDLASPDRLVRSLRHCVPQHGGAIPRLVGQQTLRTLEIVRDRRQR